MKQAFETVSGRGHADAGHGQNGDRRSEEIGRWASITCSILIFCATSPIFSFGAKAVIFAAFGMLMLPSLRKLDRPKAFLILTFALIFVYSALLDLRSYRSATVTLSMYYIPFCVFIGFLVSCHYSMEKFLSSLEAMMFWAALISLILFAFFMSFQDLVYDLPTYTFEGSQHHTIGALNVLFADGFLVKRNTGFASEPGVFQMLLNLALYQNLRHGRSLNFRNAVYVATLLTGMSTAGLAIMSVLIVAFSSKSARVAVLALCLLGSTFVETVVADQLSNKFAGSASFEKRYTPFQNALQVAIENPRGIGSVAYSLKEEQLDIGSYDAYTQTAMRYGIQGVIVLVISLIILAISSPGVALILGASYVSNSFWYLPIFSCFLFWGVTAIRRGGLRPAGGGEAG